METRNQLEKLIFVVIITRLHSQCFFNWM